MAMIPIALPSITELEISYVQDAITNGWGSKCYEYIYKFEKIFSNYIGTEYGLSTSSCTGALHLALMALDIKAGDEVIVPDITWIASVEPILYIGAKPVFVDIKKDTWCIDPAKIKVAITPKTKAIVVVHLYGNMPDMDEINRIAKKHDLKVIEDAAEALGSVYKSQKAGSIGDVGVFSFHGTKTVTTGEGGMMVTNDLKVNEKASILNNHGGDPKVDKTFWMKNYGYKYKISNLQAAMGCAQMKRVNELIEKKRKIFGWYKKAFSDISEIEMNPIQIDVESSYWMPTVIFSQSLEIERDELIRYLKGRNIDSRPFFYPLSSLPMFEKRKDNMVSYGIYNRAINLPSFYDLKKQQVQYIVSVIKDYLKK